MKAARWLVLTLILCWWGTFWYLPKLQSFQLRLVNANTNAVQAINWLPIPSLRPSSIPPNPSLPPSSLLALPSRLLTFEYYEGRFGNQIQQIEWVYRMAKMTNRTLVLERPRIEETFAGFPETWGAHEYSLWDVDLLKQSPVQLLLPGEFTTLFEPHANCVWKDDATYLATWIFHTNQLEECHGRIHLATFNGIPSEYRTDTREFGVDPMLFWTYVRFRPNLFAFAKLELQQMLGSEEPQVGIHARTFRESHNSQQRVNDKVCGPQSRTTAQILAKRLNSRKQCGCPILDILYDDVEAKWDELRLNETCDLTLPNALPAITNHTSLDLLQHGFFMATDHEDEQVDELFVKRGAKMFNFTKLPKAHGLSTIPLEWINAVEPLSLDLVALITTREFYGVPASSLTRAVCSWRMNMGKHSPMCELYHYRTFSGRCSERLCGNEGSRCCKKQV